MLPVRVSFKVAVSGPVSEAEESLAAMETVAAAAPTLCTSTKQSLLLMAPAALLMVSRPSPTVMSFVPSIQWLALL